MTEPLEHLGWTHPKTWMPDHTCDACRDHVRRRMEGVGGKAPYMNIKRLQADNAGGYTQHGLQREIIDAARTNGREINRVGGA